MATHKAAVVNGAGPDLIEWRAFAATPNADTPGRTRGCLVDPAESRFPT